MKLFFLRAFYIVAGLALGLGIVELGLRAFPHRLPAWYLGSLPRGGYELLYPGVLEKTPISGVPIPVSPRPGSSPEWHPAPQDLVRLGVAPASETKDLDDYPKVRFRFDEQGFANPEPWSSAEVLFIGDSFVVATGVLEPLGLQGQLQKETSLKVGNLGVSGICPTRAAYLLTEIGLQKKPKAVIWFFFGGNDLAEEAELVKAVQKGRSTLPNGKNSYPALLSFDLLKKLVKSQGRAPRFKPNPGFVFSSPENPNSIWFHPTYLKRLRLSRNSIRESAGWASISQTIRQTADSLKEKNIDLLLVYVPSKPQVYLHHVDRDPDLLRKSMGLEFKSSEEDQELWETVLGESDNLEQVFTEFAREQKLEFLSLTPRLHILAEQGEIGYLLADSHWNEIGQRVAMKPLKSWLRDQGLTVSR